MSETEWVWEPTLRLRWRVAGSDPAAVLLVDAEMLRVRGTTLVLEQLWRGRRGHLFGGGPFDLCEEWREVPVVEGN